MCKGRFRTRVLGGETWLLFPWMSSRYPLEPRENAGTYLSHVLKTQDESLLCNRFLPSFSRELWHFRVIGDFSKTLRCVLLERILIQQHCDILKPTFKMSSDEKHISSHVANPNTVADTVGSYSDTAAFSSEEICGYPSTRSSSYQENRAPWVFLSLLERNCSEKFQLSNGDAFL